MNGQPFTNNGPKFPLSAPLPDPTWEVWWVNGLGGDGRDDLPQGLRDLSQVQAPDSLTALEMVACRGVTPTKVFRVA